MNMILNTLRYNVFRFHTRCRTNCIFKNEQKAILSTIYALSSGYGKCGVAVIRVSGPRAFDAVSNIAGIKSAPVPRQAILRKLKDPVTADALDRGIVIWFPGPKSFTGEDSCEFQVHGGPAVISAVLTALSKLPGFRPAEPGEFSRRAFHSNKMDLTEVEGLADLIQAETESQRKQAFIQMEGALCNMYNNWRQVLIQCVAHIEAFIDFSEDEGINEDCLTEVNKRIAELIKNIKNYLSTGEYGERIRGGVRTVIVGEPNVGKSSLLNALCQRPAAIVTPIAGTTRDVIELPMDMAGYPVLLSDTAGLHSETTDVVEVEGMKRAKSSVQTADLILLMVDAVKYKNQEKSTDPSTLKTFICDYVKNIGLENILLKCKSIDIHNIGNAHEELLEGKQCIVILNKIDLIENPQEIQALSEKYLNVLTLSCKTQEGYVQCLQKITQKVITLCGNPSKENPYLTNVRHRHHLVQCLEHTEEYLSMTEEEVDLTVAIQKLRKALRNIGNITGHVNTEEILDIIFKDFCIGK